MIKETGLKGGESTPSIVYSSSLAVGTFYYTVSTYYEIWHETEKHAGPDTEATMILPATKCT